MMMMITTVKPIQRLLLFTSRKCDLARLLNDSSSPRKASHAAVTRFLSVSSFSTQVETPNEGKSASIVSQYKKADGGTESRKDDGVKIEACGDPMDNSEDIEEEEMFVDPHESFDFREREWGGPRRGGRLPEPTRFGDWERKGRCTDF